MTTARDQLAHPLCWIRHKRKARWHVVRRCFVVWCDRCNKEVPGIELKLLSVRAANSAVGAVIHQTDGKLARLHGEKVLR